MRRRTGCLVLVVVLLVVVCGGAAVADRAVAHVVASRLGTALAQALKQNGTPAASTAVDTEGFPFVPQLLSGHFDGGQVHLTGVTTPQGKLDRADFTLHDVRMPRDVLTGAAVHDVTAGSLEGTAELAVSTLAARLNLPGLTLANDGANTLKASFSYDAPVLGKVPVTADVKPALKGNQLTFSVSKVTAQGIDVPQFAVDAIAQNFTKPIALGLPFAVKLTKVGVANGYLTASGTAADVTLVQ